MKKPGILLTMCLLFSAVIVAHAQNYSQERRYEPVVFIAQKPHFDTHPDMPIPINELFVYAYDKSTQSFRMIPFQVDERILGPDPFTPTNERWFYNVPPQWATVDSLKDRKHNGVFDDHDELVFMIKDMGDRAPLSHWIDDEESKTHNRLELRVSDPADENNAAYVYIFQSLAITEKVPAPYNMEYTNETSTVKSSNYSVTFAEGSGVIKDIILYPPLGTGVDIFDSQKIRIIGFIDLGFLALTFGRGGTPSANERDFLYLYKESDGDLYYMQSTHNPVVRVVREARQTIQLGGFPIHDLAFWVTTKFYPYSGSIDGGLSLDDSTLNASFPGSDDLHIEFDLIRQSWDFNENAAGMKFYNSRNNGIPIDGQPDDVNKYLDLPIQEWTLAAGDQGALFTYVSFDDITWQDRSLYYWDNQEGGQGDETIIEGGDTGYDGKSYGDQGVLLKNGNSLELFFTAFFLPGSVVQADGEKLAHNLENEPDYGGNSVPYPTRVEKTDAAVPGQFTLLQNYPNPFNGKTRIGFVLERDMDVRLSVYSTTGRKIATLADGRLVRGEHSVIWDGSSENMVQVPSGTYFYKLEAGNRSIVQKLVLVR